MLTYRTPIDSRIELASLVHRFHEAGWTHQSVAQRNILVQPGPITAHALHDHHSSPSHRKRERNTTEGQGTNSFRLIDFGRSAKGDISSSSHRLALHSDKHHLEDCIPYELAGRICNEY
jgi:hypothetical protein